MIVGLIGLHGSGKTTLGRMLAIFEHGRRHLSVGDLARLARNGRVPNDVPVKLILELSKHQPGCPLPDVAANHLVNYLKSSSGISVDGFPSCARHVRLIPKDAVIVVLRTTPQTAKTRLEIRAEKTNRKWVDGGVSERDKQLDETVCALKFAGINVIEIENNGSLIDLEAQARLLLGVLKSSTATAPSI